MQKISFIVVFILSRFLWSAMIAEGLVMSGIWIEKILGGDAMTLEYQLIATL
jgi:hypothetical protein